MRIAGSTGFIFSFGGRQAREGLRMKRRATIIFGIVVVAGLGGYYAVTHVYWNAAVKYGSRAINYVKYMSAPKGTLKTEADPDYKSPDAGAAAALAARDPSAQADAGKDWPSYNRTLTSNRYSPLDQITPQNAGKLKVECTFDAGEYTGFNSGILEVKGALLFATEHNLYSIDPETCKLNWKAHESYTPATPQAVNRGPAYMNGKIFRGTQDGRVLAYDFKTGKKLWGEKIGGAIGGGVITYDAGHGQRVAVATGLTEVLWPTEITTAKVSILGLS